MHIYTHPEYTNIRNSDILSFLISSKASVYWLYYQRRCGKHHTGNHLRKALHYICKYSYKDSTPSGQTYTTDNFCIISLVLSVGNEIFTFRSESIVLVNSQIQMESNQDSGTLSLQIQTLTTSVEELTRQNQEMRLRL